MVAGVAVSRCGCCANTAEPFRDKTKSRSSHNARRRLLLLLLALLDVSVIVVASGSRNCASI